MPAPLPKIFERLARDGWEFTPSRTVRAGHSSPMPVFLCRVRRFISPDRQWYNVHLYHVPGHDRVLLFGVDRGDQETFSMSSVTLHNLYALADNTPRPASYRAGVISWIEFLWATSHHRVADIAALVTQRAEQAGQAEAERNEPPLFVRIAEQITEAYFSVFQPTIPHVVARRILAALRPSEPTSNE
jgi:hypothetical protein